MPDLVLSSWRTSPFFRPVLCVVVILAALFALVGILSRPAPASGAFEARCESVVLPVPAEWAIPPPDSITAFWAEARIQNIEGLTLNGVRDPRGQLDLTVGQAEASRPPSLVIQPGSQRTELTMRARAGTRLSVAADTPAARVEWHPESKGGWSAELSFYDARFEANHLGGAMRLAGGIKNQTIPARLSMSSQPVPQPDLPAYVAMRAPAALEWTAGVQDLPRLKALSASGCLLGALHFSAAAAATSSGQKGSLQAEWSSLRSLSVTLDAAEGSPVLRVQTNGEVSSLREAGRELLPSSFEQLARGAPEQQGILGVSAALLVLAAGIYLKRALEIMAKLHLPDPK